MDITVSILDSRNLSQSDFILRNLFCSLQVGMTTLSSRSVIANGSRFRSGTVENPLVITIQNRQTKTIMYARNVPISAVLDNVGPFERWVAVYTPGDPQNYHFDAVSVPKGGNPQVLLAIEVQEDTSASRCARPARDFAVALEDTDCLRGGQDDGPEPLGKLDQLRRSAEVLQAELARVSINAGAFGSVGVASGAIDAPRASTGGFGACASAADIDGTVREKELQARQIKERMVEMAAAQRRGQDMARTLEDNARVMDALSEQLKNLEVLLAEQRASSRILERDRQQLRGEEERLLQQVRERDAALRDIRQRQATADRELRLSLGELAPAASRTDSRSLFADIDQSRRLVSMLSSSRRGREAKLREAEDAREAQDIVTGTQVQAALDETLRNLEGALAHAREKQTQLHSVVAVRQTAQSALQQLSGAGAGHEAPAHKPAEAELAMKQDRLRSIVEKVASLEAQLQKSRAQRDRVSLTHVELLTEARDRDVEMHLREETQAELQEKLQTQRHALVAAEATKNAAEAQLRREELEMERTRQSKELLDSQASALAQARLAAEGLRRDCAVLEASAARQRALLDKRLAALEAARLRRSSAAQQLESTRREFDVGEEVLVTLNAQAATRLQAACDEAARMHDALADDHALASDAIARLDAEREAASAALASQRAEASELERALARGEVGRGVREGTHGALLAEVDSARAECAACEEEVVEIERQLSVDDGGELIPLSDAYLRRKSARLLEEQAAESGTHGVALSQRAAKADQLRQEMGRRNEDIVQDTGYTVDQQAEQMQPLEEERLNFVEQVRQLDTEVRDTQAHLAVARAAEEELKGEARRASDECHAAQAASLALGAFFFKGGAEDVLARAGAEAARQERSASTEVEAAARKVRSATSEAQATSKAAARDFAGLEAAAAEAEAAWKDEVRNFGEFQEFASEVGELQVTLRHAVEELDASISCREEQRSEIMDGIERANRRITDAEEAHDSQGAASLEKRLQLVGDDLDDALDGLRVRHREEMELRGEIQRVRDCLQHSQEKISYQMEHDDLQTEMIIRLEERKQRHEGEGEILAMGLHEAEQDNLYLQKENALMQQQVVGLHRGTLQDSAAEVERVKKSGDAVKHQEEIEMWKQKVDSLRREKQIELSRLHQQHQEAIQTLRDRVAKLQLERSHCIEAVERLDLEARRTKLGGDAALLPSQASVLDLVVPRRLPPAGGQRRRALLVGSSYAESHAPLKGCHNDVWSMQCLLRETLCYSAEQVRALVDDSGGREAGQAPTLANILAGLMWLIDGAQPGDNLTFFFAGYGAQHPRSANDTEYESYLVPSDFAVDLPKDVFVSSDVAAAAADPRQSRSSLLGRFFGNGGGIAAAGYRLISVAELQDVACRLPAGCRLTLLLDCCYAAVPLIGPVGGPAPSFPKVERGRVDYSKLQDFLSRPRFLDLPVLPVCHTPERLRQRLPLPRCVLHCFSACKLQEWCSELPIEGTVQGAFTWSFIKALAMLHFHGGVYQLVRAQNSLLADLKLHFKGVEQTPIVQLSHAAGVHDVVLCT